MMPVEYRHRLRQPGNDGSQHVTIDVKLSDNGMLEGTLDYENDSLWGFGNQVQILALDSHNNTLAIWGDSGHNVSGKSPFGGGPVHSVFGFRVEVPGEIVQQTHRLTARLENGSGRNLLDIISGHADKLVGLVTTLQQLAPDKQASLRGLFQ